MVKNDLFSKYNLIKSTTENFENYKDNEEELDQAKSLTLFFSFDVVNSSLYKTINFYGWSTVLTHLFYKLQQIVNESIFQAELWRILGDEAIFLVRINKLDDLYLYLDIIFDILISVVNDLRYGNFFSTLPGFNHKELDLMKLQNIISLKAAAWIAVVTDKSKIDSELICENNENILALYETTSKYKIVEFLGNDIDAGFRISKETCDRRLVISFELAYLLSLKTENLSKLNIITYKRLKGVWKERPYPIIWYYIKEKCNNLSFKDSFYYDEVENNPLAKEYFNNIGRNTSSFDDFMYKDIVKALNKILVDCNLKEKVENMQQFMGQSQKKYTRIYTLEMHCVAVCCDIENKRILIAKRKDTREINAGLWEFGCAKANLTENIIETIKREYKNDFSMVVNPLIDEDRRDNEPIPLAIYQIPKKDGLHKGIITMAKIEGDFNIDNFKETSKHSELRWIYENEIDSFGDNAVPDFKHTLKIAFEKLKSIGGD